MEQYTRIGIDTSKQVFQLHGVDAADKPILRKRLRRADMMPFFGRIAPTVVVMEACGASHHWARELMSLGHTVRLIAPQLAKPYVKRGKNDAADAEALCEAASRPTMRYVPVKTVEQQAALMLAASRERLVRLRVQIANVIRGMAGELGLVASKGTAQIMPLLARIDTANDATVPAIARRVFDGLRADYEHVETRISEVNAKLLAWYKASKAAQRLACVPGIGPVIATLLVMKTPDPAAFSSGRDFAAWLGLTPKDHSTAGKTRLGRITRAGDETLRSLLVVGATAVIWKARSGAAKQPMPWLMKLLERKAPKLAAVALANKMARVAWKLLTSGEAYDAGRARPQAVAA